MTVRKHWLTWREQTGKERWRGNSRVEIKWEDETEKEVRNENWRKRQGNCPGGIHLSVGLLMDDKTATHDPGNTWHKQATHSAKLIFFLSFSTTPVKDQVMGVKPRGREGRSHTGECEVKMKHRWYLKTDKKNQKGWWAWREKQDMERYSVTWKRNIQTWNESNEERESEKVIGENVFSTHLRQHLLEGTWVENRCVYFLLRAGCSLWMIQLQRKCHCVEISSQAHKYYWGTLSMTFSTLRHTSNNTHTHTQTHTQKQSISSELFRKNFRDIFSPKWQWAGDSDFFFLKCIPDYKLEKWRYSETKWSIKSSTDANSLPSTSIFS